MLKRALLLIFIMAVFSLSATQKHSLSVDYVSKYIWRGMNILADDISAIQPSYTYEFNNKWYFNFFSSFALEQREQYKSADEVDFKLGYILNKGHAIEVEFAYAVYVFCSVDKFTIKDGTTNAAYVKFTANDLPLTPYIAAHYDFNKGNGAYFEFAVSKNMRINKLLDFNLFGSIGYNNKQYINARGFSDIVAKFAVPVKLGKTSITPFVKYIYYPINAIRTINGGKKDDFLFGLSLKII